MIHSSQLKTQRRNHQKMGTVMHKRHLPSDALGFLGHIDLHESQFPHCKASPLWAKQPFPLCSKCLAGPSRTGADKDRYDMADMCSYAVTSPYLEATQNLGGPNLKRWIASGVSDHVDTVGGAIWRTARTKGRNKLQTTLELH